MKILNLLKITSKSLIVLLVVMISAIFLNGCDEDSNPIVSATNSYLQITNASPNSPNYEVFVNTTLVASGFNYLSSTAYGTITGNAVSRITVYSPSVTAPVIDTSIYCEVNKSYSFFLYDSTQKIKPLILTDNLSSPGSINANIRLVDLSPNSVTIDVGGVGKTTPWFPFYSFPQTSAFRPITGGVYTVYANLAGTGTTILSLPDTDFAVGRIYTILVRGFEGASGTNALGFTIMNNN